MPYSLPSDTDKRPIAIAGAGTLGRRIAAVFAAGGSDVRIFDQAPDQRQDAIDFVAQQLAEFKQTLGLDRSRTGMLVGAEDLESAVRGAWMVIEAVPEKLEIKRAVFAELDNLAQRDAILASNSSSLPSSQMIGDVRHPERVLNTHYYMPPQLNAVELMSCGKTDEGVIEALMGTFPQFGLVPFHVRRESDGFIFNRIWAAIKRECLMVVDEGVAAPSDVDGLWEIFVRAGTPPFELMDRVGLDVVLDIEEHYAAIRPGIPEGPRRLLRDCINRGRLGVKTGRGFYEYPH
jgi:3-hydroxybutyryl-CoA dehydrogenase